MTSPIDHAHAEGTTRVFLIVWFWLLALTGVEVFLGYEQLELKLMLVLLMGLSVDQGCANHRLLHAPPL